MGYGFQTPSAVATAAAIECLMGFLLAPRLVVANPPHSPMLVGYRIMDRLADFSSRIIAIMPWLWMINSQSRHERWRPRLRGATQLPRSTFPGARIQTAIFDVDLSKKFSFTKYM